MIIQIPINAPMLPESDQFTSIDIVQLLKAMRKIDPQRFIKLIGIVLSDFETDINLRTDFKPGERTILYLHLINICKILKIKQK